MKNKNIIVGLTICIVLMLIITGIIVTLSTQDNEKGHAIIDLPNDAVDEVGYDYSQYDILKEIVDKFNTYGGRIIDIRGNETVFPSTYNAYLKDDVLLISYGNELYIYHIHDIRKIRVN